MDKRLAAFYELYSRRRSIREFAPRDIDADVMARLLEVLRMAQSAGNRQPWHFIVVHDEEREAFNEIFTKDGFKDAPVAIVACAEPERAWQRKLDARNYAWVDLTIAVTEMIGAATAEGLGTCWVAALEPLKVKKILDIPEDIDVVAVIVLGYPTEELRQTDSDGVPIEKDRLPLEKIIHYGKW
jgi:nitroreductase